MSPSSSMAFQSRTLRPSTSSPSACSTPWAMSTWTLLIGTCMERSISQWARKVLGSAIILPRNKKTPKSSLYPRKSGRRSLRHPGLSPTLTWITTAEISISSTSSEKSCGSFGRRRSETLRNSPHSIPSLPPPIQPYAASTNWKACSYTTVNPARYSFCNRTSYKPVCVSPQACIQALGCGHSTPCLRQWGWLSGA